MVVPWRVHMAVLSETLLVLLIGPVVTKPWSAFFIKGTKPVPYSYKVSQSNHIFPSLKRRYTKIFFFLTKTSKRCLLFPFSFALVYFFLFTSPLPPSISYSFHHCIHTPLIDTPFLYRFPLCTLSALSTHNLHITVVA